MDDDLLKKAEGGDAQAQAKIADCYYWGASGYKQNYATAVYWYRRAADQGHTQAQFCLGCCLQEGKGDVQDNVDAFDWYRKAALKGHAGAQNNLAICYRYGTGTKKDLEQAHVWFSKAAENGDANAGFSLADNYFRGEGCTQDFGKAIQWFLKAAEQGHPAAEYFVGWCYLNGKGVTKNANEALIWYRKAANHGYADAVAALQVMQKGGPVAASNVVQMPMFTPPAENKPIISPASNTLGDELLREIDKINPDLKRAYELIGDGAALDGHDEKWRTPLILAAWRGHKEIVAALIKAKAPLNDKDNLGNTALIFAAWQGHAPIVDMLIKAGADIDVRNKKGYSALVCASSNGHQEAAKRLVDAGASLRPSDAPLVGADAEKLKSMSSGAREALRRREQILKQLDVIVGQNAVKARLANFLDRLELDRARAKYGLPAKKPNLHTVFTGAPGTGKTTVARLIGKMFKDAGILSKGHVVEISPADVLGVKAVGESAMRMTEKVKQAQGGILFIDEAYNFTEYKGARSDHASEATDVILRALEDPNGDIMVIIAGYADQIQNFLTENPGMKSRFQTYINFVSYSPKDLADIYEKMADEADYVLAAGCRKVLDEVMPNVPDRHARTFGNARFVRNFFDETLKSVGARVATKSDPTREDVTTITASDIRAAFDAICTVPATKSKINRGYDGISFDLPEIEAGKRPASAPKRTGFEELESLVGLANVKKAVKKTAQEMQFFTTRSKAGLPVAKSSRHFVFTGNPGTGKTTVARILGGILKDVGYLERGHVVETAAVDLIGQFIGQTGPLVAARVADAMGGILFIDEAYALTNIIGTRANYTQEAVSTLLKLMEDYRDKFVVVAAGYQKEMKTFVDANPGLKSRFTDFIEFEDYGPADLEKIFIRTAQEYKYVLSDGAAAELTDIMSKARGAFHENFPNGRFVRNLFEDTIKNLASRVASKLSPGAECTNMDILTIIEREDILEAYEENVKTGGDSDGANPIGFRFKTEKA